MTEFDLKINASAVSNLLSDPQAFARLLEPVLNEILQHQAAEQINAQPYERSEKRTTYRNGNRPRTIFTRVGKLTLQVPQFRDGSFNTTIFKRYQRSEKAR